jgi:hypothetical protein
MNVILIYEINNILCLGITMKFRATITKNESAITRVIIRLEVGSLTFNEHMHLKSIAKKQYKQISKTLQNFVATSIFVRNLR